MYCYYIGKRTTRIPTMQRILIIEDESPMAEALSFSLEKEGYAVEVAADGKAGLDAFEQRGADLVLLDLMLPGVDGLEVCRRIRFSSAVPIIMLTARDTDIDEVVGLEMGADDYVTKPFNTRKLMARIKAALRRSDSAVKKPAEKLVLDRLAMDRDRHEVFLDGQPVHLTPIEYRILETLMVAGGNAVTREKLLEAAWQGEFFGSYKTLDVHVRRLRRKIEDDPANPSYITTVRGVGYRLGG